MKKIILSLCFLTIAMLLNAAPITVRTAQTVARNFWIANGGNSNVEWVNITSQTSFTEFYIFSNASGEGFIIVAADDCVIPILGYSLSNVFEPKIPDHVADFLEGMNQEIAYWKAQNLPVDSVLSATWSSLIDGSYTPRGITVVSPLLTTTWRQQPRYNNLCPASGNDRTLAGCVAIATAQIMKYWNWPTRGIGSHSYYHDDFGTLSADFGNTVYQWSQMPNALSSTSTTAQINAVATLVYHVGVSVEMDYGVDGSGATTHDYGHPDQPCPRYALADYFNYKNTAHSVFQEEVTDAVWTATIKDELDLGRPVLHSGRDTSGGHAFVCDGYDINNLFHINWGWGGSYDGYYPLNDLSPSSGGAGSNATHSFNLRRGIVVGIEPNKTLHANTHDLYYPQAGGTQPFTLTFRTNNNNWTINSSQSWLTVSTSTGAGTGGGMVVINATATANNTGTARTALLTITQGTEVWTINAIQNECSDTDMCAITLNLNDSYGDGWNGASLTVSSSSGYLYGTYTFPEGHSSIDTIHVCPSSLVLSWNSGNYDNECSFSVKDANGATLLNVSSISTSTSTWNINAPCGNSPTGNCAVNTFPWLEDFESTADCWTIIDADGDGNTWSVTTEAHHTGAQAVMSYSYSNDEHHALHASNYLISPKITLPSSGDYRLNFYVKSANSSYPDSLAIKLSTSNSPTVSSFTTTLMPKTVISMSSYQLYTINLNNYLGQTFYLAFIHQSYDGFWISLDDISIERISPSYTITVNSADPSMGTVTGGGTFTEGTQTTISATASNHYHFTQWHDGNNQNPRTITVTGDTTYTASFAADEYLITTNSADPTMGAVTGGGTFEYNTTATLTATAYNHHHFTQWNDGNTQNPRTITVTGDATYTASFAADQYLITVISADPTMGTVTGGGTFDYGTTITISATANPDYTFTHWNDENTINPRTFIVDRDATYTAYFQSNVGIEDLSMEKIRVFSNGDQIHVLNAENLSVEIYDILGQLLFLETANTQSDKTFSIRTKGFYLVKVGNGFVKKVVAGN